MKKITIIAMLALAVFVGCSKKSTPVGGEITAEDYLAQGWTYFGGGHYSDAQTYFDEALGKNSALADAYNGKGWCQGILGQPAAAVATFQAGLSHAAANNEIKAGLAFSYSALDSASLAVAKALEVLAADSLWQFSHPYRQSSRDNVLNYKEATLLLAQCYFKLGQFSSALARVQKLNPGFAADVGTTAGQSALQAEIERLAGTM